jgi:uncharacterized protein YbjT (DUF2867 family)
MKAILFGATGMIGQGVLRECLLDPEVESVVAVVRRPTGKRHEKLREIVPSDFFDFSSLEGDLSGFDACFFCLGVSSAGMSEAEYRRVTYDVTMAAARVLAKWNPGMTFLYMSGAGADSTESGRAMWARVKGATENALRRLPFKAAYVLRPAYIQPLDGIVSRTKWTRLLYAVMGPLYPLWKTSFPKHVTTTEELARAMIRVAKRGASKPILESADFAEVLRAGESA